MHISNFYLEMLSAKPGNLKTDRDGKQKQAQIPFFHNSFYMVFVCLMFNWCYLLLLLLLLLLLQPLQLFNKT